MTRAQRSFHTIATVVSTLLIGLFAIWWFNPVHIPNNFHGWYRLFDIILFVFVTYIIWHPILMDVLAWSIASHIKKPIHRKPRDGLRVAVVTTFVPSSESISLLHKTLPALTAIEYPHDTWVLDEGNDEAVKEVCRQYGVNHFSRHNVERYNMPEGKFASRTKGGNHNSWYDTIGNNYDIVAQMDTDFVAHKDYLTKTLGYFEDARVAFVGTPQIYGNTHQSLIAKGAAEQTFNFYGPILRGLDGMDTTLLIGANHVIRVSALKDVNHYSAHITEDLLTGMKLHAKGWKSVYVPEALAIGEGPTDWKSYFSQQKRWAYGCMHILFKYSPRLLSRMNIRRCVYYFLIQQHYFSGMAMALSIICLSLYFMFGLETVDMDFSNFILFYLIIIVTGSLMSFWLQQFNVRPKKERGVMWAGMYISIAAWPIFFMAFLSLFKKKKLVYQVTPKGKKAKKVPKVPFNLFLPHLIFGSVTLIDFISSFYTGRSSPVMLFWALISTFLMFLVPILVPTLKAVSILYKRVAALIVDINHHYRIFEFKARDPLDLPSIPTDKEKYMYTKRKANFLILFSIVSFTGISFSTFNFIVGHQVLWILGVILILSVIYFIISLIVNLFTKDFDVTKHKMMVESWKPVAYPSVDIFLPVCGEPLRVLNNTWCGVEQLVTSYPGRTTVYCLDDGDSGEVKRLAATYGYNYVVRANRGYFKKAGNLRNGFRISSGDFIAIFDADFVPRKDFLNELLPYFSKNPALGIVQSPQYFDVNQRQNWLERGAGAVQELFYRVSQVSRQSHGASICVGSNAVYRRRALNDTGGTALIEHSEDVHTGFNLRMHGWQLQYVPIILAKGLCPSSMLAFFKQQYRWCMGSMSLLTSVKFWKTDLRIKTRLSYISGFLYYIHTAIAVFYTPSIPLVLLIFLHADIYLINYVLILPAFIFTQLVYPIWHRSTYGVEAWATRMVYGWAHIFAISDMFLSKRMTWHPTGTRSRKDIRYSAFRFLQIIFNLIPAILWVFLAGYYMIVGNYLAYLPMFVSGVYYLLISSKVSMYLYHPLQLGDKDVDLDVRVTSAV